ncbi:metallophosphoesterase [Pararhodobacter oceanensis]|uniref:metallophosphoesterase n=1 Tax=Pararhodobacter oceanensis TaxID=2172121 RepID=UPI003A91BA39
MRSYAIGDIHGHLDLLHLAHKRIEADRARTGDAEAPVLHLGDLVDRGPNSRGVIETLLAGQIAGKPWIVLRGNHDTMFARFPDGYRDPVLREGLDYLHQNIGGSTTLAEYGIDLSEGRPIADIQTEARKKIPNEHRSFLLDAPLYHRRGPVLYVHAGIRPERPLQNQTEADLCWIRKPFHDYTDPHPWLVIHGHTPVPEPRHYGNRVNIDSGAAFGGPLTAIVVESTTHDTEVYLLTDTGRTPLTP